MRHGRRGAAPHDSNRCGQGQGKMLGGLGMLADCGCWRIVEVIELTLPGPQRTFHLTMKGRIMGLLDGLLGKVTGQASGGAEAQLLSAVTGMLGNQGSGGLAGLVDQFTKGGLGDVVSSWVGTGQNLPISAEQISKALGSGQLGDLAKQAGVSPEKASSMLASVLPGLVDSLTPNGKLPEGDMLQQALSMFKGKP
ncbi:MAG: hypothetical protein H6Q29_677 [Bacteroidetes bacterium]|nr:hypothetical protein [Bacteroidota bacterium]